MVIDAKQTTVAYRCPHCGSGIMSGVGIFNLSADMIKLKCSCGKSEMTIVYTNDNQIRLNVPCILCPKPHNFVVSKSIFFGRDLFVIPCPYSGLNVCFMGELNHVKAELARTELELLNLLEKNGISSFEALHKDPVEELPDPQILDIVTFVIHDLADEGNIFCKCADHNDAEYDFRFMEDGILIFCQKCGASKIVPVNSLMSAQDFLNCDSLQLE